MYRLASSIRSLSRTSNNVLPAFSSGSANFSTSSLKQTAADADGEPDFLEMVRMFADNAHSIALDKLLSAKPAPGKRQQETAVREKHIRGDFHI